MPKVFIDLSQFYYLFLLTKFPYLEIREQLIKFFPRYNNKAVKILVNFFNVPDMLWI